MNFAKHETFHIRDGWLHKGLKAIERQPNIFLDPTAPEQLGLGKNMVRALRYWMQATGLTVEEFENRTKVQKPTLFGDLVKQHDPYLEYDGTLWLLHFHLVTGDLATSWYWFFNLYAPVEFTRESFMDNLENWINVQESQTRVSLKSLHKDFDCLTRMYLPGRSDRSPEDLLDSPLSGLGLLASTRYVDEETGKRSHRYRLQTANPQNIPPLVFLFVLLRCQQMERGNSRQVNLNQALREPGNVGRVFNIGVRDLEGIMTRLEDDTPQSWQVSFTRTGGLDLLTLPDVPASQALCSFYGEEEDQRCSEAN